MTRARSLKQAVRARAAKTGERYTTARRQILQARARTAPATPPVVDPDPPRVVPSAIEPQPTTTTATTAASRRGSGASAAGAVSNDRVRERTGHDLDHWFAVLDGFNATAHGHTAAARHLRTAHGVDSWYSQGITVAYERLRGRGLNQRSDGSYEVSISKVVPADAATIVAALTNTRRRAACLRGAPAPLVRALARGLLTPGTRGAAGFIVRADGRARIRYRWESSVVEWQLLPKSSGRTSVVVVHTKLESAAMVAERRSDWRALLAQLADAFE